MSVEPCVRNVMFEADVSEADAINAMTEMLQEKDLLKAETDLEKVNFELEKIARENGERYVEGVQKDRQRVLKNIVLAHKLDAHVRELRDQGVDSYKRALLGVMRGIHWGVTGARRSTAGHMEALESRWFGHLSARLDQRPHVWKMMEREPQFLDRVVLEMSALDTTTLDTTTGDKDARWLAEVLRETADASYNRVQLAGGDVSLRTNWVPQRHDPSKMLSAGKEEWVRFLTHNDILDMEKTFGNLPPEMRADALGEIFYRIKDGEDIDRLEDWDIGHRMPADLAEQLSKKKRALHFKSGDAWLEYHKQFGRGNVFTAVIEHIRANARDSALMEYFGNNPQVFMERYIQRIKQAIKADPNISDAAKEVQLKELPDNLNTPFSAIGSNWSVLTGQADRYVPTQATIMGMHLEVSKWPRIARAITNMSKLGMASITSITDIGTSIAQLRHQGVHPLSGFYEIVTGLFHGKTSKEKKEIANLLGVAFDAQIHDIHARFMAEDAPLGKLAQAEQFFFKISLLTPWTERMRQTFALVSSSHMAAQSPNAWEKLDDWFRLSMEKHGIGERDWDLIRNMEKKGADGREYITPDGIRSLPEEAIEKYAKQDLLKIAGHIQDEVEWGRMSKKDAARIMAKRRVVILKEARRNIEDRLSSFFLDETNNGVTQPGVETKAWQTRGVPPGTVLGEVWRCLFQFKSFPIAFMQKHLYGHWRGGRGGTIDKSGLAQLIVSSTLLGLVAAAVKDIAKGREPRDITNPGTWAAAFTQGGGAGILGDFFLNKYDRMGSSPMKTVEGPVFNSLDDLVRMAVNTGHGDPPSLAHAMYWGVNNTPFVNLWYTRQALDYLILYHLQEFASPGYLRRMERRLKKEYNQEMLFPPSTRIKRGGGWK